MKLEALDAVRLDNGNVRITAECGDAKFEAVVTLDVVLELVLSLMRAARIKEVSRSLDGKASITVEPPDDQAKAEARG